MQRHGSPCCSAPAAGERRRWARKCGAACLGAGQGRACCGETDRRGGGGRAAADGAGIAGRQLSTTGSGRSGAPAISPELHVARCRRVRDVPAIRAPGHADVADVLGWVRLARCRPARFPRRAPRGIERDRARLAPGVDGVRERRPDAGLAGLHGCRFRFLRRRVCRERHRPDARRSARPLSPRPLPGRPHDRLELTGAARALRLAPRTRRREDSGRRRGSGSACLFARLGIAPLFLRCARSQPPSPSGCTHCERSRGEGGEEERTPRRTPRDVPRSGETPPPAESWRRDAIGTRESHRTRRRSYSLTFDNPGEFKYYCIYHPSMVGDVIVE